MSTAPVLDPVHTALLVMDYQPAILAALPEGGDHNALLGRVEGAIAHVRANGGTIAYVRVGFTDADGEAIPAINKSFAPLAQHRVLHHADPATAIHERLAPQGGDIIVRKLRYSRVSTTEFDQQLASAASPLWSSVASAPAASSCPPSSTRPTATTSSTSCPTASPTTSSTPTSHRLHSRPADEPRRSTSRLVRDHGSPPVSLSARGSWVS